MKKFRLKFNDAFNKIKNSIIFNRISIVCVIIMIALPSCNVDEDPKYDTIWEVSENSNPDDIRCSIKLHKKKGTDITIHAGACGGKLAIKTVNIGGSMNLYSDYTKIETDSESSYSNHWLKLQVKDNTLFIELKPIDSQKTENFIFSASPTMLFYTSAKITIIRESE